MSRVTLRVPDEQVADIDDLVEDGVFPNRSEAVRAGIRKVLQEHRTQPALLADGGEDSAE